MGNLQPRPPAVEAHAYSETSSANSVGNMQPVSNEAINSMFVHNKNPYHTGPLVSNQHKRTHQHSQVRPSSCEASSLTRVCYPTTTGRRLAAGLQKRDMTLNRNVCILFAAIAFIKESEHTIRGVRAGLIPYRGTISGLRRFLHEEDILGLYRIQMIHLWKSSDGHTENMLARVGWTCRLAYALLRLGETIAITLATLFTSPSSYNNLNL
ncbi:hypothetical protein Tco_0635397 [Tanacetum coccineum]